VEVRGRGDNGRGKMEEVRKRRGRGGRAKKKHSAHFECSILSPLSKDFTKRWEHGERKNINREKMKHQE
jgi:hypothetical protein